MPTYKITLPSITTDIEADTEKEAIEYFWYEYNQVEEAHQNDLIMEELK